MKQIVLRRLDDARPLIPKMQPFRNCLKTGYPSISARSHIPHAGCVLGSLPERYWASVESAAYIVWSYYTPIAWFATIPHDVEPLPFLLGEQVGQWVVPNIAYSITTGRHQCLVECALRDISYSTGWGYPGRESIPSGGDYRRG